MAQEMLDVSIPLLNGAKYCLYLQQIKFSKAYYQSQTAQLTELTEDLAVPSGYRLHSNWFRLWSDSYENSGVSVSDNRFHWAKIDIFHCMIYVIL